MKKENKNKKGFTLIEILVVVLIIGILAAIALPQYRMTVYKSRYTGLMNLVNSLAEAEERYYIIYDDYSRDLTALDIDLSDCTLNNSKTTCSFDWGQCALDIHSLTDYSHIGSSVYCTRTNGLNNSYAYYMRPISSPNSKWRICIAKGSDTNNIWNQVCKKVGATTFVSAGSESALGSINMWKF